MSLESENKNKRLFSASFSPENLNQQKRRNMPDFANNSDDTVTNSAILDAINKLSLTTEDIKSSVSNLQSEVRSINQKLSSRIDKTEKCIGNHSVLINKNRYDIERIRCSKEIVIMGVPELENEKISDIFIKICAAVGYVDQTPVVFIRRIKGRLPKQQNEPFSSVSTSKKSPDIRMSPILVEFSFHGERKQFMLRYFKCDNLNLSCLGFSSTNRIFVNENLTKHDMEIKRKALTLKKTGKVHSVFILDGRVFVRQDKSSQQIHIDDIRQLGTS